MTGISEILVLILLILCILFIPRMIQPKSSAKRKKKIASGGRFSMKVRAAIVLSIVIVVVSALLTKPWSGGICLFVLTSILPVGLGWALAWIFAAKKK